MERYMKAHLRSKEENITMNKSETTNNKPILYSIVTSILIWGFYLLIGIANWDVRLWVIIDFIIDHTIISSIMIGGIYYWLTFNIHSVYSSTDIAMFLLISMVSAIILGLVLSRVVQGDDVFAIVFTFPRILIVLFSIYIFMIIESNMRSIE